MRYVFFGTPRFAAIVLEKLIGAGMPPAVLVCNPDKPVGRKKIVTSPPTKQMISNKQPHFAKAMRGGQVTSNKGSHFAKATRGGQVTRVFQPANKAELTEMSDEIFADVDFGIVAAYAQIIPGEVIKKAKLGIVGVHPSLLPKLRGATPLQTALLEGLEETGVTLFMLDENVDNGPTIASGKVQVTRDMDYLTLEEKCANLGGDLLVQILPKFVGGKVEFIKQDESEVTLTKKIKPEDAFIEPSVLEKAKTTGEFADEILRKIRALNPEPGVFTEENGKRVKLLDAEIKDGKLKLTEIQREGKLPVRV